MDPESDLSTVTRGCGRIRSCTRFLHYVLISQGYIWDWALAIILIRINRIFLKHLPHNERLYIEGDASLSYPLVQCWLPHDLSWHVVFYATPVIFLTVNIIYYVTVIIHSKLLGDGRLESRNAGYGELLQCAALDFHAAYLSLIEAYTIAATVKHIVERSGKLRPNWFARLGTGDAKLIKDGRESYPSGHALYPTMAATLLTLYMLGRTQVMVQPSRGQFALFIISMLPLCGAIALGLDRVDCYDHDFVDTVSGGLIGSLCALLTYHLNFYEVTNVVNAGKPRLRIVEQ